MDREREREHTEICTEGEESGNTDAIESACGLHELVKALRRR